jgi:hypothetical protein
VTLNLFCEGYEAEYDFQVIGDGIGIPHDGVLGQDFWETMQAKIDYERKEIHMGNVTMKFDKNNQDVMKGNSLCTIILEPRSETIVQLLTTSAERSAGTLGKMEVAPGVYVAEFQTTVADGKCVCSVINVNNNEVAIRIAQVELEVIDDDAVDVKLMNEVRLVSTEGRIREVSKQVRLEHLSIREGSEILKMLKVTMMYFLYLGIS